MADNAKSKKPEEGIEHPADARAITHQRDSKPTAAEKAAKTAHASKRYEATGIAGATKFTKEVSAKSERHARHTIYSLFGAANGLKRPQVKITAIKVI